MEKSLIYRLVLVGTLVVIAVVSLMPTVYYDQETNESHLPEWWTEGFLASVLPQANLNLGLDLQGGMDLVISVNVEDAVIRELNHFEEVLKSIYDDEDIAYDKIEADPAAKTISFEFPDNDSMRKGMDIVRKNYSELVSESGRDTLKPVYVMHDTAQRDIKRRAVEQVRNVLVRRMDAFGLREPEILVQGDNEIRLQLPGAKNPGVIKEQIVRTAKLDFMLVEATGMKKEAALLANEGVPPAGQVLVHWVNPTDKKKEKVECFFPEGSGVSEGSAPHNMRLVGHLKDPKSAEVSEEADYCYLLREDLSISGSDLADARAVVNPDPLSNDYMVSFTWKLKAAQRFAKLTGENIGRQLAVVLEGQVNSAPVIQAKIFNRGQITGNFTADEATNLSTVLRSGSLDVSITFEEERTVGASLGADSIKKSETAIFWGAILVIVFMIAYYHQAGIIADIALILNILFIMALLSILGATLTLPGIAGIVLTVGMAVDANVLIFERVREELRFGKTPIAAIDAGYGKALWTILDANITTLIAALVLMQWGTGPIKGFGVTLSIGIVTSMFTAIIVTRTVYDFLFTYKRSNTLSIGISHEPAAAAGKRGRA